MTLSATRDSVEDRPLGKKRSTPPVPDSVWLTDSPPAAAALHGRLRADIAIVGGGITGLSAAYHFKRRYPNKQIVVLEGQRIGFGASGRNSGFISREYHGWDDLFFSKGAAAVEPYAEYAERGYRQLVETIAREAIDCDLRESGALRLAKKDAEVRTLEKQVPAYAQLGRAVELWQGKDLAARIGSEFYPAGVFLPHWATLHPGKLVRGLSKRGRGAGRPLSTNTPRCNSCGGASRSSWSARTAGSAPIRSLSPPTPTPRSSACSDAYSHAPPPVRHGHPAGG